MPLYESGEFDDVLNDGGTSGEITVGDTTPVEVKVGASAFGERETLRFYNKGPGKLYYGFQSNVTVDTGELVWKRCGVSIPLGFDGKVYLISDTANTKVIVHEVG
jgi:hypothetical protein